MVASILFDFQIAMDKGLICRRKGSVMKWAFFATWMRKEQVHRLLVSKKGFLGLKQILNLNEDAKGELMENKVLVVPL